MYTKGLIPLKKNKNFTIQDVTKDPFSYYFANDKEIFNEHTGEQVITHELSKGTQEKQNPLPVINAISKAFFQTMQKEDFFFSVFHRNLPNPVLMYGNTYHDVYDVNVFLQIIWTACENLNMFQYPYEDENTHEKSWWYYNAFYSPQVSFMSGWMYEKYSHWKINHFYPHVFELLNLIMLTANYYQGDRLVNQTLKNMENSYLSALKLKFELEERRLKNWYRKNYPKETDNRVYKIKDLKNQVPILNDQDDIFKYRVKSIDPIITNEKKIYLGAKGIRSLVELAWHELFFARYFDLPLSVCTFCGEVYYLKGSITKSTCGKEKCKKQLRKQQDTKKRNDPTTAKIIKEQDRERKRRQRAKQKAINMHLKEGKSIGEIASILKYPIEDIQNWII